MLGSFKIGTAFGIPVRLHWTFVVGIYLLALFAGASLGGLILIGVLFGCVFLHELGHSLVARRYGIRVVDITFWPLGGMARMSEMPEDSEVEGVVAIAGPAVNFVLAALGFLALLLPPVSVGGPYSLQQQFIAMNLMLGVFNLIPAFPMDGGRILRAWFARKHDWLRATEMAVAVGRVCAVGMFLVSLFAMQQGGFCVLPLIALFVWFAGGRELLSVRLRHAQAAFGGPGPGPGGAPPFFGFEPPPPPGPGGWARPPQRPAGGFSEDDIRELERYRGRLRPPGSDA